MKCIKNYLIIAVILNSINCLGQIVPAKYKASTQKGILVYYLHEPYFLPIADTTIGKIANSKTLGLKLENFILNDILDSISHKQNIVIYTSGINNSIDTVRTMLGVLFVKMNTKYVSTKLSSDTAEFNFEYRPNSWGNIRYQIRFDFKVVQIEPLYSKDKKALKRRLHNLQSEN